MEIRESNILFNIEKAIFEGSAVSTSNKLFKDIKGIYLNSENVADDTLMYTVYTAMQDHPEIPGHLNVGMTVLMPVYINDECNMTRGHFHDDLDCAEVYIGISGEGLLVYMDQNGFTFAEKVYPGSTHLIDGKLAHRLVNTGEVPFKVGAVWPSTAGHNYAAIEAHEFEYRIFKRNGEIVTEKR